MTTKGKKEAAKKVDIKWEGTRIHHREEARIRDLIQVMPLPTFDENFTNEKLLTLTD